MTIIALEKISTSKDDSNKSGSEEESVDVDVDEDDFTFSIIAPRKSETKKDSEDLYTSEKRLTEEDKENIET